MTSTTSCNWASSLRPGMILSFRFPLGEGEGETPKARPCLVLAVMEDPHDQRITLAYATSADTPANRGVDLDLSDPRDCQAAGLHRPTRWVLARRVTVPSSDKGFVLRRGSPVIGTVPSATLLDLRWHLATLGEELTMNHRRGAPPIGRAPRRRWPARQDTRLVPVIVRVTRRRLCKPAARVGVDA
ncbi:hypothetical protein [uncultured Paracoccus sp.]|uniref:hypothetical protein n=1 Tax=uncultured Paracoccus sp. TaxID=189685 RepID=UPI0025D8F0A9|nr:hypothetical protein [uncultured Paracoccus sp.]